ncbi:glycosyltransferase family 4 protein [Blastopirellula marina]|uniref:Glycosyltransferase n=1 Tax=Blastopirellula marina DSM 3645 TaxID=314230 RepID=A3ZP85_9BACT|nr:glycosyltransferase family 4 protein [Blastopirellula marina]EAQ81563.1 glycosyltransferase [Blastopirellula marina DSM 3645]
MKSHIIVTGDFVRTGGMDRANYALADYLSRCGDMVHLVGHRADSTLVERPNVEFHRVPKIADSYFLSAPWLNRYGQYWSRRLGAQDGITLVNGGNCLLPAVNWVHYVHAAYSPKRRGTLPRQLIQNWKVRTYEQTERSALGISKLIIVNSERTKLDLMQRLQVPEDRIRLVYYSVDLDAFYPADVEERAATRKDLQWSDDRKYVLFVGSPSDPRKGFDTVLQAWKAINSQTREDLTLAVLGRFEPKLEQEVETAGLRRCIQFFGLRSDLARILRASDALVSPTRYEAYGLGVHEALCCGIPTFVSSDAGVAERYPESLNAFLLPDPHGATDLAERLQNWRRAPDAYRNDWLNLASQLRSYTWDDASRNILEYAQSSC